jgi:hypothetical protein
MHFLSAVAHMGSVKFPQAHVGLAMIARCFSPHVYFSVPCFFSETRMRLRLPDLHLLTLFIVLEAAWPPRCLSFRTRFVAGRARLPMVGEHTWLSFVAGICIPL